MTFCLSVCFCTWARRTLAFYHVNVNSSFRGNIDAVLATCPHNLDGRTIDPKACNPRSAQKPKKTATQHCPKVLKYYH